MFTLITLRLGLIPSIGIRIFGVRMTKNTFSCIVTKTMFLLEVALRLMFPFPSSEEVKSQFMPDEPEFQQYVSEHNIRIIIDGTELRHVSPTDTDAQKAFFSIYKNYHTSKYLVGITPNGRIRFVSVGFPGAISDDITVSVSGLTEILEIGDGVLADKGYQCFSYLSKAGAKLITPKRCLKGFLSCSAAIDTRRIARYRIHIERAINAIKRNLFLKQVIHSRQRNLFCAAFAVAALLTNFNEIGFTSSRYLDEEDDSEFEIASDFDDSDSDFSGSDDDFDSDDETVFEKEGNKKKKE